jgi:integrase
MAKPKPKVKVRYREQRQCWEVDARRINQGRPTFLSEEEAQQRASALVKEHAQDLPDLGEDRDITLREYWERWLPQQALEARTIASYTHLMTDHVLPVLGPFRLRAIRRRHIRALLNAKRADAYAKNTVRLIRAALSSVLTDAVEDEILDVNPALHLSRKRKGVAGVTSTEPDVNPMDWAQLAAFRAEALKPKWWPEGVLLVTYAMTGLRPGEGLALRSGDADFQNEILRVERALSHEVVKRTKTAETRKVDLNGAILAVLKAHLARLAEEALGRGWGDPAWLFPSEANTPLDYANTAKVFARILKAAKLPHFRVYDLRHTYASLLLSAGAPLLYVSQQLGHKKPTTTLRYYAKYVLSGDRRWVDLLGRDLAQPHADLEPETGTKAVEPAQAGGAGATSRETENAEGARGSAPLAPSGEPCRNRTYNLLIKSQLLYQLS